MRQAEGAAPLRVRVSLPPAHDAEQALPLLDDVPARPGVEDVRDRHADLRRPRRRERGEYAVQPRHRVVGDDPERVGVERVEGAVLAHLLGPETRDVPRDVGRRLRQQLEEDADVHGRVAGIAEGVFEGIGLGHAQQRRLLGRETEGAEGIPLDVAEGGCHGGGWDGDRRGHC